MRVPRAMARATLAVALFAAAVWNGIFDFLVVRGQHTYLQEQARAAAGWGPSVSLHDTMGEAVRYAALVASAWAATTLVAGLLLIWYVRRATLRERRDGATSIP